MTIYKAPKHYMNRITSQIGATIDPATETITAPVGFVFTHNGEHTLDQEASPHHSRLWARQQQLRALRTGITPCPYFECEHCPTGDKPEYSIELYTWPIEFLAKDAQDNYPTPISGDNLARARRALKTRITA